MPVKLQDTPEAIAWLALFTESDALTAKLLLNSLRLISADYFDYSIKKLILAMADKCDGPIALYAAREVDPDCEYFPDKRKRPVVVEGQPGSEGQLGYTVTQVTRSDPSRFLNHPPIATLKKKRCRHIVIVDDIVGSGNRIKRFMKSMRKERSLYSWISFGWVKFHVVAFAVNKTAETKVRSVFNSHRSKKSCPVEIHFQERPVADSSAIPSDTLLMLKNFCERIGKQYKIDPIYHTGYAGNMANIIFSHKCPNNVPGILWWNRNPDYKPLFSGTFVPPSIQHIFLPSSSSSATDSSTMLFSMSTRTAVLRYMSALSRKLRLLDQISADTGLNRLALETAQKICFTNGWIDENEYLTAQGRRELRHENLSKKILATQRTHKYEYYFPKSLRKAREAI